MILCFSRLKKKKLYKNIWYIYIIYMYRRASASAEKYYTTKRRHDDNKIR